MQVMAKNLKLKNPLSNVILDLIIGNGLYNLATKEIEELTDILKYLDAESCYKDYCREINVKFTIFDDPHLFYAANPLRFSRRYFPLIFSGRNCFYIGSKHVEEVHDINGIQLQEVLERFKCTNLIHKQNSLLKYLALIDKPMVLNVTKTPISITSDSEKYTQLINTKLEKMAEIRTKTSVLFKNDSVNEYDIIRILGFDDLGLVGSFEKSLETTSKKKIVIDLRGNQGGLIEVAKQCASYFLTRKILVYKRFCNDKIIEEWIEPNQKTTSLDEILILQNERTASAAETIFIPALKKSGQKVVTLGRTSAGFISQATRHTFADGGVFTLSTGILLNENSTPMLKQGIEPDYSMNFGLLNSKSYNEILDEYKSLKACFTHYSMDL